MKKIVIVLLTFGIMMLSACSKENETPNQQTGSEQTGSEQTGSEQTGSEQAQVENSEPVTLQVHLTYALEDVFKLYLEPVIKEKLPHITLEYVAGKWDNMIAGNSIPDITMPNDTLANAIDLGLPTDLTPFIENNEFDLSRIDSSLIQSIRNHSDGDELYATPATKGAVVLVYNKDIFDKLAMPYPEDGMSWDDAYELARDLTRIEDGVQYKGLHPGNLRYIVSQLELSYFDENGKADLTTDGWKKVARMWKDIAEIPGNMWSKGARGAFVKDRDTAMAIDHTSFLIRTPVEGLNWDIVTMPTFENELKASGLGAMFVITTTSEKKEAAFDVIQLYHSDEVQTAITRDAALPTELTDPDILKQYGANIEDVRDLNVQANFKGKHAVKVVEKDRVEIGRPIRNRFFNEIAAGEKDINTALREAEELINQELMSR